MDRLRHAVLTAASTLQYDSATLPARQLNVLVLDEPFSKKQQLRSRLDGGLEINGETERARLEVTSEESQGHVEREQASAEAQQGKQVDALR